MSVLTVCVRKPRRGSVEQWRSVVTSGVEKTCGLVWLLAAGCWGHDGATSAQLAAVAGRARHVMERTEAGQSRAH